MQATEPELSAKNWTVNLLEHSINDRSVGLPIGLPLDEPDYFLHIATLELTWPILRNLIGEAHYMPASRSGILQGHKTLAGLIVGRASRAWLEPMEIPRLAGVVTDLIQSLLFLDPHREAENPAHRIVEFLEKEVTRGTVGLDRRVEYPEIYYENESGRFLLHQVSSMVSEMAPIVLFLKYLVRPGQLFIIEEPESHLDADNQRKLARAIAMLINSGVKVLITTHSDFFVNQINNLLLLSQIPARSRAARKYSANEVLEPDNVGAYLFKTGDDGSMVETLEVTAESGIPTFPFTDAHSALYNEAIRLEHSSR
jgi:predicted ATPase